MTREPVTINVAIGGLISTGVALAALLWPGLTSALQAAIIAFGNSLVLVVVIIITRMQVTPVSAPQLEAGTEVGVLRGGYATGETGRIP